MALKEQWWQQRREYFRYRKVTWFYSTWLEDSKRTFVLSALFFVFSQRRETKPFFLRLLFALHRESPKEKRKHACTRKWGFTDTTTLERQDQYLQKYTRVSSLFTKNTCIHVFFHSSRVNMISFCCCFFALHSSLMKYYCFLGNISWNVSYPCECITLIGRRKMVVFCHQILIFPMITMTWCCFRGVALIERHKWVSITRKVAFDCSCSCHHRQLIQGFGWKSEILEYLSRFE